MWGGGGILFGWIIYGIAGQCVPLVFGPSGAGGSGCCECEPEGRLSLCGDESISSKLERQRETFRVVAAPGRLLRVGALAHQSRSAPLR